MGGERQGTNRLVRAINSFIDSPEVPTAIQPLQERQEYFPGRLYTITQTIGSIVVAKVKSAFTQESHASTQQFNQDNSFSERPELRAYANMFNGITQEEACKVADRLIRDNVSPQDIMYVATELGYNLVLGLDFDTDYSSLDINRTS